VYETSLVSYEVPKGFHPYTVHRARFLELSRVFFGDKLMNGGESGDEEKAPLYNSEVSGDLPELAEDGSWLIHQMKSALWYLLLMPL
jgi:hypothetical protein